MKVQFLNTGHDRVLPYTFLLTFHAYLTQHCTKCTVKGASLNNWRIYQFISCSSIIDSEMFWPNLQRNKNVSIPLPIVLVCLFFSPACFACVTSANLHVCVCVCVCVCVNGSGECSKSMNQYHYGEFCMLHSRHSRVNHVENWIRGETREYLFARYCTAVWSEMKLR
jgi:hypothetical protein